MLPLLATLLLLTGLASAAPCVVAWDAQPPGVVFDVRRGIDLLATVATHTATVDLPTDQLSTLTVTARLGDIKADRSDPFTVQPNTIEYSTNLAPASWQEAPTFFTEYHPALFIRIRHPKP